MATTFARPFTAPASEPAPDRGLLRRAALAIGMFALVVTGVHAGADRADDALFELISLVDRGLDGLTARALPALLGLFGAAPATIEGAVLGALELVDLDEKLSASRALALVLEALVGLALAVPFVDPRAPRASRAALARASRSLVRDPTLLLWVGPTATAAATIAGLAVVATAIESVTRTALGPLHLDTGVEALTARVLALGVGGVVLVVLAVRGSLRTLVRADALAQADAQRARAQGLRRMTWRRRLRGGFVAVVGLPLSLLAAGAAVPVLEALVAPWSGR